MGNTSGSAQFAIVPVHDAVFAFHEPAEPDRTEVHVPEVIVNRFEADVLLHEQVADADPAFVPADAAVATDVPYLEVAGIRERLR